MGALVYEKQPMPGRRGTLDPVSPDQMEWAKNQVIEAQHGAKGAVKSYQLRNILNIAHRHTLKERGQAYHVAKMGRRAMSHMMADFRKLPGITFKKRNVRTPGRSYQERQVRNHASFIATFEACANDPDADLRLLPHQFGMMDMVGITIEQKEDVYAFTAQNEHTPSYFLKRFHFRLNLCCVNFLTVQWPSPYSS
jgi:hypothetical protein